VDTAGVVNGAARTLYLYEQPNLVHYMIRREATYGRFAHATVARHERIEYSGFREAMPKTDPS
jgi:hypothetical protein